MSPHQFHNDKHQAEDLCQKALVLLHQGQIASAIDVLKSSIALYPTEAAHTYLGWAYSREGKFDLAIRECFIAVELNPYLGTPYNDIGAYLVQKGKITEAEEWFRKAIEAPDYEARHFAFTNLARILQLKGNWFDALTYYDKALEFRPDYKPALESRMLLHAMMN
ncbi:MAG: tetratricopeptide repeat protein [Candidatus Kapaibacterium sp.]|jgi:Tfp pilus assembly protein PilF